MSNHVHNQHTVPQFLLRHFSNDKKNVWTYDKQHKQTKKRSIESLTVEQLIYDKIPGQKEGSYEYNFQRAEDATAPIILKIIKTNSLNKLNQNEKVILSIFVAMQFQRTKNAMIKTDNFDKELRDKVRDFAKDVGVNMEVPEAESKKLWLDGFDNAKIFAEHLYHKRWFLVNSQNGFYSSDNPVVLGNIKYYTKERNNLGLNSKGIEIYLPLSGSVLLAMYCQDEYKHIKNGQVIEDDPTYYNSLQTIESHRFIFANNNNFSLAEDMIKINHAFYNPLNKFKS